MYIKIFKKQFRILKLVFIQEIKAYAKLKSDFISSNNADTDLMTLMYEKCLMFPMNYTNFYKKKHLLYKYLLQYPNVILIFISDEIEIAFKSDYNNENLNVIKDI